MTNKLTVLGLVAATAFIFTSCTKDNDTSLNDRLIAPVATLEAPALDEGAILKGGNEYADADNGQSIPSIETAPVADPQTTPPIWNNANRYQEYYMEVKNVPTQNPVSPVLNNSTDRINGMTNQNPNDPWPNVAPPTYLNPKGISNNAGRNINDGNTPDCTFPVIGTQNAGELDL